MSTNPCTACEWTKTTSFPDPKLTAAERRFLTRAKRQRDELAHHLRHLTDDVLADLIRRNREPATDALASGTNPGGNDTSKPTEAAAIRDAGGHTIRDEHGNETETPDTWEQPADPIHDAINTLFAELAEANGIVNHADKTRGHIFGIAAAAAGRQSSLAGNCARCSKPVTGAVNDKLISGYCPACRKAWERANYPDRLAFEKAWVGNQRAS